MVFAADCPVLFDRLDEQLRSAPQPAQNLFANIIGSVCTRIPVLSYTAKADRLARLVETGAWTDAALALIELELPAWSVRRLVRESGEWLCSLSRQPNIPPEIDDGVDAVHEVLPLAVLRAFVEARRRCIVASETTVFAVPQLQPAASHFVSCDNYA